MGEKIPKVDEERVRTTSEVWVRNIVVKLEAKLARHCFTPLDMGTVYATVCQKTVYETKMHYRVIHATIQQSKAGSILLKLVFGLKCEETTTVASSLQNL